MLLGTPSSNAHMKASSQSHSVAWQLLSLHSVASFRSSEEAFICLFHLNGGEKRTNNQKATNVCLLTPTQKRARSDTFPPEPALMARRCLRGNVTLISKPRPAAKLGGRGGLIRRIIALLSGPDFDFRLNYLAAASRSRRLVSDFSRRSVDASLLVRRL